MATVIETPGAYNANSYESAAEATQYFDERLPLNPPWPTDPNTQAQALIMATRTLDSYSRPYTYKTVINGVLYDVTRQKWTGAPATATQALAWPRIGMYDGNGYPLDVAVVGITATTPTIIQTGTPHRLSTGKTVFLFNTNSLPNIDGAYVVTVITSTTFSIPTTVLTAGNQGTATVIPKELKWATSEFAGQLIGEDRTLDSDIARQKLTALRAGSVALSFGDGVTAQVIPDAVTTLLVPSWLTTEVVEGAVSAEWTVV